MITALEVFSNFAEIDGMDLLTIIGETEIQFVALAQRRMTSLNILYIL